MNIVSINPANGQVIKEYVTLSEKSWPIRSIRDTMHGHPGEKQIMIQA